jgi:hypothetical protein
MRFNPLNLLKKNPPQSTNQPTFNSAPSSSDQSNKDQLDQYASAVPDHETTQLSDVTPAPINASAPITSTLPINDSTTYDQDEGLPPTLSSEPESNDDDQTNDENNDQPSSNS